MNISYRWLRAIAPTITADARELADQLGMLGAPVDELVDLGAELGDVVIARVDEVRPHPNADRLRVCTVDAGSGEPLQVVCGAPNVEAGRFYPFAPVGAELPGGVKIGKAKLRGELSQGMLCSARELGLGRDHSGLMTLNGEWQPGEPLVSRLGLDDARLVVDITPNRSDLLSHLGVARELAPGGESDVRLEPFSAGGEPRLEVREGERSAELDGVRVSIDDPAGCTRYMAAIVRGVRVGPSPEWLATRLRAIGLRPINNVVDATNYVLHELGQPLHAFDLHRLSGGEVRVRRARPGETLRTLDGVERTLGQEMLVIADAQRPVALAGVMGGEESEVSGETRDVLLECALFEPLLVRRTARGLGLSTDASYRFERGVDPELQPRALRRVVDLILATAGGEADAVAVDVRTRPFTPAVVEVRPERVARLLGVAMDAERIRALLSPLGLEAELVDGRLRVRIPGSRPDLTREVDLVEEVARRHGYDNFPEAVAAFRPGTVPQDPMVAVQRRVHDVFARWGFLEARTVAFAPASEARVPLLNPLSAEESHLRDELVPGLLRRVEHNWAHGVRDVRLYEIGSVFFPAAAGERPREEVRVAAAFTGARRPVHWAGESPSWDLWDLKALLTELAETLGEATVAPADSAQGHSGIDPQERLVVRLGGEPRGAAGPVAPGAVDAPAWAQPVWVLEVTLPAGAGARPAAVYRALPEFPPVERDLALLVPFGTTAEQVGAVITGAAGELLDGVWPFDLYAGKGIPENTRSVAWRLRFRHPERTLTDAEVDRAVQSVLSALEGQLGVHRR